MSKSNLLRVLLAAAVLLVASTMGCAKSEMIHEDSFETARQRLITSPQDAGVYLHLAELYLQRGDYLRARQYLALLERHQAAWAPAHIDEEAVFRLGILCAVRSHQYVDAVERCQRRLEAVEDLATRLLLATLLEAMGDEAAALHQHRLILLRHAQEPHPIIEAARFYERSNLADRSSQAQALYQRYLETAPLGAEAPQARAALSAQRLDIPSQGE